MAKVLSSSMTPRRELARRRSVHTAPRGALVFTQHRDEARAGRRAEDAPDGTAIDVVLCESNPLPRAR
jgi:hypothetical protein